MAEARDIEALAEALKRLGCPPDRAALMARQLDKRAEQLSEGTGRTREQAMAHLLSLMSQGWASPVKRQP